MNILKNLCLSITAGLLLQQNALAVPAVDEQQTSATEQKIKQCDHNKTSLFEVKQGYVKMPIPGVSVTAAYFKITNTGNKAIAIKSLSSNVSKFTELHDSTVKNDKMVMRQIKSLTIKPQETVTFEPGAKHIMLMSLTSKLKEGEKVTLNINLDNSEKTQTITLPVMKDAYVCPHSGKLMSGSSHE